MNVVPCVYTAVHFMFYVVVSLQEAPPPAGAFGVFGVRAQHIQGGVGP